MNKVYEIVTEKILKKLESGLCPWDKPWNAGYAPQNFSTKRAYNGLNALLLANLDYKTPFYASFKQIKEKGGTVKPGEHGYPVIFWLISTITDGKGNPVIKANGQKEKSFSPRYYTVFNLEQTTLKIPDLKPSISGLSPIDAAEKIIKEYESAPGIIFKNTNQAFYTPLTDTVTIPEIKDFKTAEGYYNTMFHELGHSTGHKNRLSRNEMEVYNHADGSRSKEELIAEMTAGFLRAECNIDSDKQTEQTSAYIKSWLSALSDNKEWIVSAAQKASKAASWILNKRENITKAGI